MGEAALKLAEADPDSVKALNWGLARVNDCRPEQKLRDAVWRLLQDAADTLARLPDRERGWLLSADRAAWPEVWHSAQERYEAELQRLQDGKMSKEETPLRRGAITDPTAIPRMLTVLGWLQYVRARTPIREKRDKLVVLAMAQGQTMRSIRRLMLGDKSDGAARMVKQKVLGQICWALQNLVDIDE